MNAPDNTRHERLISVVVPAYNYGHLLPRALDSVVPQLDSRSELVVINDGSTDDTAAVLEKYHAAHPEVMVVSQVNKGPSAARNNGIAQARGKYVLLLDADDELMPDALRTLTDVVDKDPSIGLVLAAHYSVFPDGREKLKEPATVSGDPYQRMKRCLLEKKVSISHGCALFLRDLLLQRPYPEEIRGGEDLPVFAYMLANANTVSIRQAVARIYKHEDSLRHSKRLTEADALRLAALVFEMLPVECQPLRKRYESQRLLSLFRAEALAGERAAALGLYKSAFARSPRQAMRWSYARKAAALMLHLR